MIDALSSFVSSLGSVFAGVLRLSVLILALQGLFLGLMVLFYGRRSFWVFASVVGFVLGMWLAVGINANLPAWAQPLLALVLGMAGAALGFFAPRPAAAIIGGLVLALLGVALAYSSGAVPWLQWLIAVALGFVGVYLFWRLLDWALIVGSSLLGAILVALSLNNLFDFTRGLGVLPFLLFLAAGIIYQARDRQMVAELQRLRSKASPAPANATPPASLPPAGQPALLPPPVAADTTAVTSDEVADSPAISELPASEAPAGTASADVPATDATDKPAG